MEMYFIDYDTDQKKFSWGKVMSNLFNPQAKYHRQLVKSAHKQRVEFDMDDFFAKRKS